MFGRWAGRLGGVHAGEERTCGALTGRCAWYLLVGIVVPVARQASTGIWLKARRVPETITSARQFRASLLTASSARHPAARAAMASSSFRR
ncbi:hypothetical protein RKD29_007939 [Streptomyces tendae]